MSHQQIIDETSQLLAELSEEQATEVLDFAAFLRQRQQARTVADEALLNQQIQHHLNSADTFAFLHDEAEDIYTLADVKFHYDTPLADAAE